MNKKLVNLLVLLTLVLLLLPATVLAQGGTVYTAREGDTLVKIAQKEYNNPLAFQAIVSYNNDKAKTDKTLLVIADAKAALAKGAKIYLPTTAEVETFLKTGATTASTAATAPAKLSGELQLAGSTSVQPVAELLATAFMKANPGVKVTIQGGGSGVGVTSAAQGTAAIGNVSRNLKDDEKAKYPALVATRIAIDGLAIVINTDLPLTNLTLAQVKDIFSGKIANFKEVGGPDAPIVVVAREEGSGTRDFFQEAVMGKDKITEKALVQQSNGQIRTTVASTPNAIGFLSFGFMDKTTTALTINGVAPTVDNVKNGAYKLWRNFNMVTKGAPKPLAQAFFDFIFSPEGQAIVSKEWIAVDKDTAPLFVCPAGATGALKLAGSTSVQPLAEKFAGELMKACPAIKVEVSGGGSGVGVTSAYNLTADIGNVSRDLSGAEKQKMPELKATRIAVDGVAIVVNANVKLSTLSLAQVKDIFAGKITNFKQVGGPDAAIVVVAREEGSGTRDFFQEKVMGKDKITEKALVQQSNGQVRTTVASTPNAIGFVSFGFIDSTVKAVAIDNVQPTAENVNNGTYPLWRYFNMVTKGAPNYLAQIFLNFVFSPQGHDIILAEGYMTQAPN